MRRTLRRSCAACAKAKHSCDLRTPKCSRCVERNSTCSYANEPLGSADARAPRAISKANSSPLVISSYPARHESPRLAGSVQSEDASVTTLAPAIEVQFLDPFNTYPQTNLPRARIQQLIHHFLSKIVYQYYPWDTNPRSNPFVTSWWQLALADPALFHVSLQTASRDDELHAQKGFESSEILMRDSVSLVRQKIQDPSLAFQDATLNAVVTLAAIEHGMGNLDVSMQHIEGIKRMVQVRGGIPAIKASNPLTSRMVSWVAMLVTGLPQFAPADDLIIMNGTIQWREISNSVLQDSGLIDLANIDLSILVKEIFSRLQNLFTHLRAANSSDSTINLSVPDGQDLASFVIHQLLWPLSLNRDLRSDDISESLTYGICLYMFVLHGPTYYSHVEILKNLTLRLQHHLIEVIASENIPVSLITWLLSVGMVSSIGTENHLWWMTQALALSDSNCLYSWEDVTAHLKLVLWFDGGSFAAFSRQVWGPLLTFPEPPHLAAEPEPKEYYT